MQRMRDVHESRKQPKKWMMFSKIWSCFSETQDLDESNTIKLNHVFANRSKKDEIFPLTVKETHHDRPRFQLARRRGTTAKLGELGRLSW